VRALTEADLWVLLFVAVLAVALVAPALTWLTTRGHR
jgi:hypothetical protein